jgi:hypothetical protein
VSHELVNVASVRTKFSLIGRSALRAIPALLLATATLAPRAASAQSSPSWSSPSPSITPPMTNWEATHAQFRSDVPYYQQGAWDAAHATPTFPLTSEPWSPSTPRSPSATYYAPSPYPVRLRYPTFAELFAKKRYSALLLFGNVDVGGPHSCAELVMTNGVAQMSYGGPHCKKPMHEYVILHDSHVDNADLGDLSAGTLTSYRAWAAGGRAK